MSDDFATIFVYGMAVWPCGPSQLLVREVSVMPDRTGSAVMATLDPSPTGSSPVADTLSAVDWPAGFGPTKDWPTNDEPDDEGPPDDGPGLVVNWTGGVTLDQVLSAMHRYQRHRAGLDLPAWGEAGHSGKPND